MITGLLEALVSTTRVELFLKEEEIDTKFIEYSNENID